MEAIRRKLEIGSCRERLEAVRELAAIDSREACELLAIAVEDIDQQVRQEAIRIRQESCWYAGPPAPVSSKEPEPGHGDLESLF